MRGSLLLRGLVALVATFGALKDVVHIVALVGKSVSNVIHFYTFAKIGMQEGAGFA